ncbi:MAG: arginase [Oscillochloris sp.]|nr:arginase [Oscillochloris sp.]
MDLFAVTTRPIAYQSRNDPHDRRLGDVIRHDVAGYQAAEIVILGCPQDEGVRRNGGRIGAAAGPAAIRAALARLGVAGLEQLTICDLGDTQIQPELEATHSVHQQLVQQVIADSKLLIVFGGGNDISYPDCAGLAAAAGPLLAFNIDAHYDVRADQPANSGTPYCQLLSEGILKPQQFVELGSQPFANSPTYTTYLQEQGVRMIGLRQIRARGLERTLDIAFEDRRWRHLLGLDIDVVRAADAPGVSAPNPLGMSGEEFCLIAEIAGGEPRTRLIEISEVNPQYDIDGRTARLAATAIWHALAAYAARR